MKKRNWKSMLAFMLAMMIVVSAVPVTPVNASDAGENTSVSGNEDSSQDEKSEEEEISVSGNEMKKTTSESENIEDENAENQQTNIMLTKAISPQENTDPYGIALTSDNNAPVIESFSLEEQGKTLTVGDEFHITITGYDQEGSDLSGGYIWFNLTEASNENKSQNTYARNIEKTGDKQYCITYKVPSNWDYEGTVEIVSFEVWDEVRNETTVNTAENGAACPSFILKETTSDTIKIKEIKLSKTEIELTDTVLEDSIDIELVFEDGKAPTDTSSDFEMWYRWDEEDGTSDSIGGSVQYNYEKSAWVDKIRASYESPMAGTFTLEKIYFNGAQVEFAGTVSYTVTVTRTDTEGPTIESVELYYAEEGSQFAKLAEGAQLKKKGTLQVRAKVEDPSGLADVYVSMKEFLPDVEANIWDHMTYDETLDCYIYIIDVSQLYATEWAVSHINASDTFGNQTSSANPDYACDNLYFYVKDESNTITLPECTYEVYVKAGNSMEYHEVTTGRQTSLKEIFGKVFPDGNPCETEIDGLKFLGWSVEVANQEMFLQEEDTFFVSTYQYVYVEPVFDKMIVSVYYWYYDVQGQRQEYTNERVICENGLTYGQLMAELGIDKLEHCSEFGFNGWTDNSGENLINQTEVIRGGYMYLYPQYQANILDFKYSYTDKDNNYVAVSKAVAYESSDTYRDVIEKYLDSKIEHTSSYIFTDWECYFDGDSLDKVIGVKENAWESNKYMYCYAKYSYNSGGSGSSGNTGSSGGSGASDNSGSTDNSDSTDDSQSSTTESTVVIKPEETKSVVTETTLPVIPQLRQEATVSEFPTLSGEEEIAEVKPAVKLEEEVIAKTVEEVQNLEEGAALVIEMAKEDGEIATEVPVAVLEAVKGKNVTVVLDMGGYSWTINGQDVLATNLSAINLEVTLDTEAVAPSIVEKLAGEEPTRQISLTHNGDFGFKASLTINLGSEHEGEFGNLYYHDSNGKLVFMNAGQIDADGNVSLDFSHASDYVVVVGRDRTEEEAQKIEESMPAEIISEEVVPIEEEVETTGYGAILVIIVAIVIAAAVGIVLVRKNKK